MKKYSVILRVFLRSLAAVAMLGMGGTVFGTGFGTVYADEAVDPHLEQTILDLDTTLFDAFNHCDAPAKFKLFSRLLATDLEFYHDKDGLSNRTTMLRNTHKNVCGHYRRELIAGSLKIYPIGHYGAMEQGAHRFCEVATGKCVGQGEFITIWRRIKNTAKGTEQWQASRMLSFAHRPLE